MKKKIMTFSRENLSIAKLAPGAGSFFLSFIPSLLIAVYPILLLYQTNIGRLTLASLSRTVSFYAVLAFIVYLVSLAISRANFARAGNSSFVFMIFFVTYGWVYNLLLNLDWFRVEHYTLLPLYCLLAVYAAYLLSKINARKFRSTALIFTGLAVILSLVNILPVEINKAKDSQATNIVAASSNSQQSSTTPDVYFIIMDEFAGFNTMRSYWKFQGVDQFAGYLEKEGFYVAQNSKSGSDSTFHELAERLNYSEYPAYKDNDVIHYFDDIYNSKVMQFFKDQGYSTVAFDETHHFYASFDHVNADYTYDYNAVTMTNASTFFDDFGILVADKTMLFPFSNFYRIADPKWAAHAKWISFTAEKLGSLKDIPDPKFVFVHVLLPHNPFMFDKFGNPVDPQFYFNWNYYLGNYEYSITVAKKIVSNIKSQYNSTDQPIIILQSDHGARNINAQTKGAVTLTNYPQEDKYDIMNALYLPGYDYSTLTQDIKPINTFPIILNYYFGQNIPLK